jgi:hypothetical protein
VLRTRLEIISADHFPLGRLEIVAAVVVISERIRHASRSDARPS